MVFVVKKKDVKEKAFDVISTLGIQKRATEGAVGLEIEVEGKRLPKVEFTATSGRWVYHQDGSLRGEDNAEYVLSKPIAFDKVRPALDELWAVFKAKGSILDESNRTSVHVHLNVQKFYLNRLTSLMALYFIFEEILTEWCGEHRVGNLFCLRAKDAPAIVSQIRRFIRTNMQAPLREHHHYAGLNTNAIHKFGSLEFRPLRGVSNPEVIMEWVGILERLYTLSETFTDPREICHEYSGLGPMGFFEQVLGSHADIVRKGVAMDEEAISRSMYDGIRLAQDLCYVRDWAMFLPINLKVDPFGRDTKTIIRRISTADTPPQPAPMPNWAHHEGEEMDEEEFFGPDEDLQI